MSEAEDEERIWPLDSAFLEYCARKGLEGGPGTPQAGPANAAKVRRVMQLTRDLARKPFRQLRILDLGCGEGVYAIEAALRGATVLAVDARPDRMSHGLACARLQRLESIDFVQRDVRGLREENDGTFDVIFALGILYHFDVCDLFSLVEQMYAMCKGLVIIDTFVSRTGPTETEHAGRWYRGEAVREHESGDNPEMRRGRMLRSLDNEFSFWLTLDSLIRLLHDTGFSSILQSLAPPESGKPGNRVTLVALRGSRVKLSTYPWINDMDEAEVEDFLAPDPTDR